MTIIISNNVVQKIMDFKISGYIIPNDLNTNISTLHLCARFTGNDGVIIYKNDQINSFIVKLSELVGIPVGSLINSNTTGK